ncbi:LRR receptor-like serine/threonine-protein kinase FLS2 [Tanacetum coccineum]
MPSWQGRTISSGTIPDRIGELKELQFLDLSQNQLSGIIPEEISKIPTLKYLNLSFNQLQGKVPDNGIFKNRSATGLLGNPFLCFPKSNKTLCNYNPSKPSNHFLHVGVVTLTTVLSSGLILGAILVVLCFRHFRRKNLRDSENAEHEYTPTVNIKRFYRKELEDATNNFSEGNILGVGRLSTVYKGKLADGRMIAVKTFNFREHSAQSAKSFKREMETLGKLRHRNLWKVLGYAWESQRLQAVVLEYMENGNLDNAIHNSVIYQSRWTLSERVGVLVSVSRGLFYLHTGYDSPIVHCDLKPSNILLDDKWNARVSDFETARILEVHQQNGSSICSASTLVGTIGYLAPEFAYMRKLTTKVDVFSFGIIVMEFITRKRPTGLTEVEGTQITLPQLVDRALSDGHNELIKIVDPYLLTNFSKNRVIVEQLLKLALSCTKMDPKDRPDMNQVMNSLSLISKKL